MIPRCTFCDQSTPACMRKASNEHQLPFPGNTTTFASGAWHQYIAPRISDYLAARMTRRQAAAGWCAPQ
mgnify:CR=1 FL=1